MQAPPKRNRKLGALLAAFGFILIAVVVGFYLYVLVLGTSA
jgi:hypothetical protein